MKKLLLVLTLLLSAPAYAFDMTNCEVKFSPKGGITKMLVDHISAAKTSIHVSAYSFTSTPIAAALVAAKTRGIEVSVILDDSAKTANGSKLNNMLLAGVPTWIDYTHSIAHNKTILIDALGEDPIIQTGSFNYSYSAEYNNGENAIVCHSAEGAKAYLADWIKHQGHSIKAN